MLDPFKYFEGGRDGIKRRLADKICEGMKTHNMNCEDMERELELKPGSLTKVVNGDLSELNLDLAETVVMCLSITWDQVLGEYTIPEEDQAVWLEHIKERQIACTAPVTMPNFVKMVIFLQAIQQL